MKFILIYGAPATGKLTVAKELEGLTSYKLLHNHMVVDLVGAIDETRTPEFFKTYEQIITNLIEFAIKRDISIINTFVYGHGEDDDFMRFLKDTVIKAGGEIFFIQLSCDKEVLLNRVVDPSRQNFGKLIDPDKLNSFLNKYDLSTPFEDTSITIDNSNKSAKDVAKEILNHIS